MTGSPQLDPLERVARQMRPQILQFWVGQGRPATVGAVLCPPSIVLPWDGGTRPRGSAGFTVTLRRESRRSVIVAFPSQQGELPFVTADPQPEDCPRETTMADAADLTTEMDERLARRRATRGTGLKTQAQDLRVHIGVSL